MSGAHDVIELLSSSDEASSSDSEPRRPPRRTQESRSSSSEEEKAQLQPKQRQPARPSPGVRLSNGRRRKRIPSSESEGSRGSESEREERETLEQLNRPPVRKKAKVAPTKSYVAPVARPRHDRRADGEMRQITEGMNFAELQAQQQMMARFQAQNRRKAPPKPRNDEPEAKPKKISAGRATSSDAAKRASSKSRHLSEKMSFSELQAQERTIAHYRTQNSPKFAPTGSHHYESASESEESEGDDDWDEFTRKSEQRETRRHAGKKTVEDTRSARKNAAVSKEPYGNPKPKRTQLAARKSAPSRQPLQQKTINLKRTPVMKPSKTKRREVLRKQSSSSSEEDSNAEIEVASASESDLASEAESEVGSEEKNGGESDEDAVMLVEQRVPQPGGKVKSVKKKGGTAIKRPSASNGSSKRKSPEPRSALSAATGTNTAQVASRAAHHGVSERQSLSEKMSFEELQAQEKALSFFHAQKKRHAFGASTALPNSADRENGSNGTTCSHARKTNGGGRRARMGVTQGEAPQPSSSVSFAAPPCRSGFLSASAQAISPAKCTAKPAEKPADPVIHSTAWRRLIFAEAPSNILEVVSTIPYSAGSDKPLWDYDPTKKLKEKCKFVGSVGQGVAITEDNYAIEQLSQNGVDTQVRELVEQELPCIKECHSKRAKHILRDTRKQVAGYLKAHQVLRGELVRRLEWSEIANQQSWLDVSPIERVTARRLLQNPTHTVRSYNYLVGRVRYFVHRDQIPLESLVYPETVTHLPNDITPIRRSFTMIGIRKNDFVEDDTVLRYVPYLGDGERLTIDNDLYTETTMSKERLTALVGEGKKLKVKSPSVRDDEVMEYLLRIIVGKCGASEQVFLALQHEAGFDRPRLDYCQIQAVYEAERTTAKRIAKMKGLIRSEQGLSLNQASSGLAQVSVSEALRKLAQQCWFLRDPPESRSLAVRLQPPVSVFESCYAKAPDGMGLRNYPTYDGLVEWHRDLFCRRCYSYDCSEHGIQNPQRSHRADPVYPMVTASCIMLARQEIPIEENDLSAEDGTPNSSSPADQAEVIELTGTSSEDETEEKKNQEASAPQPEPGYRRSRRAQTRISSLASNSLQIQEKLQEAERLVELEKRRKRHEKFARAADKSEYLDNSYLPSVTTTLQKLLSKRQPCSPSCWLSVADKEPSEHTPLSTRVDLSLVRKLASTVGQHACLISAMLKSPRCTCADISRFLVEEKKRRDSGDDLGADNDPLVPSERRRKPRRHNGGVGSNRSSANRVRTRGNYDREKKMSYKPCNHDGVCDETCDCTLRGHSCNKTCSCPRECLHRFQGCKCSTGNCQTSACPCWDAGRECDPDYCFSCGASDAAVMAFHPEFKSRGSHDLNICLNVNLLRGSIQRKVGVAFSATHGWGAYALEPIRKDEFVLEYTGELITDEEAERRGAVYDRKSVSYLFGVNAEYVVDAARKGNKAKFANHEAKEEANLAVKIIVSNGEHRIGLFAREAIEVGAELFFDYGYSHDTAPKWSQLGRPDPKNKRAYDVVDDDENEWEQWD